jgi:hypothetical protein
MRDRLQHVAGFAAGHVLAVKYNVYNDIAYRGYIRQAIMDQRKQKT